MGTNYYRVRIPTEADKIAMHACIDEGRIKSEKNGWNDDDIEDALEDIIAECTSEVHICKMSYGWKTCFDHNWGKYYQPNRKSLEEFLSAPNTVIKDEYGRTVSYDEFWKLVDKRDNSILPDGRTPFTAKTYDEWEKSRGNYTSYPCLKERAKCEEKFGVICEDDDFEVDNLRFAVYSDFC